MSGIRVRVGAIVLSEEGILLVQHQKGEATYWLLPGGGLEAGETMFACVAREVQEETGLCVTPERVVFISESLAPAGGRHILNVFIKARLEGGHLAPAQGDVISAVAWMPLEKLAALTLHPPVAGSLLQAVQENFSQPVCWVSTPWV